MRIGPPMQKGPLMPRRMAREGLNAVLDRSIELELVGDVAKLAVPVARQLRERRDAIRAGTATRTDEIPTELEQARADRAEARREQLSPVDGERERELERPDARHVGVASLAHVFDEPNAERAALGREHLVEGVRGATERSLVHDRSSVLEAGGAPRHDLFVDGSELLLDAGEEASDLNLDDGRDERVRALDLHPHGEIGTATARGESSKLFSSERKSPFVTLRLTT